MADIYTPPSRETYLLLHPFYMPTEKGSVWAIAVSSNGGTLLTAGISIVLTLIFVFLWNIVCFVALAFPGSETRRRHVALVTLWNSNDSWFAFGELAKYSYHYFGKKADFAYGLSFCLLALVVYGSSLTLGIVGPSLVQIGSVAPVRPTSVYYPAAPKADDNVGVLEDFGLRAPANLRALGSVEAARVTTRGKVNVDDTWGNLPGGESMYQLTYNYSMTGVDLGLQHGSDLALFVVGSCITEYNWFVDSKNNDVDAYSLWGKTPVDIPIDGISVQNSPKATFLNHPEAPEQYLKDGNTSFAIIPWSAHRFNIKQGSNPWYKTESLNVSTKTPYNAAFRIKRARPALSCWQQDRWSYGSTKNKTVENLQNIPGMKVKSVLLKVLRDAFGVPMLVNLGTASGDSALRSGTTSANGVINAEQSSIYNDLERLLVASYVASRNVFVDTTMFQPGDSPLLRNVMRAPNNDPEDGAGDIVVSSPDIQTFSMAGLIVFFVALLVLCIVESLLTTALRLHQGSNKQTKDTSRMLRLKALSTTQLFRQIYEAGEGKPAENWSCQSHFPEKKDETDFELSKCSGSGSVHCKGHIKPPSATMSPNTSDPKQTKDTPEANASS